MAASAYGAVLSLMHVVDNIQHPARQKLRFDRNQIETLREKVSFFLDFLEEYSELLCNTDREELARQIAYVADEAEEVIDYHVVGQLQRQIADVADEAEHVVDSHVVDQLSQRFADKVDMGLPSFFEDLDRVLNKIESIKKELMMIKDQQTAAKGPQLKAPLPAGGSSAPPSTGKINTMVGFDEHLVRIMDMLTGDEADLQIFPIVGMGGIGKTTLARNAYHNCSIVDHFDYRTWFTISQSYSIQDVLLGLLGELEKNKENNQNSAELGGELHKRLFGRKYLIVMDDVWSTKVWDELRLFFPDNRNGSRIIVTTRLSNVADSLGNHNSYLMDFLDEQKSWKLLCQKAFGKEICPNPELEKIGMNIVKCCKGLPLAISVIGGLLRKSNMTQEDWELVAKDIMKSLADPKDVMKSLANSEEIMKSLDNSKDDADCTNILSLSYKHLPIHLKPCFLYLRVFPEDEEIDVDTLTEFWVAEGFVKQKGDKTLEEVAREYLKDLTDRNLILIHDRLYPFSEQITTYKVHDLLRDLCIREYENEQSFRISKVQDSINLRRGTCSLCCYRKASTRVNLPKVLDASQPKSIANCFVCDVCRIMSSQNNRLRLVKVVDKGATGGVEFLQPTRLRYLKIEGGYELDSTLLPLIWNLQFLDLGRLSVTELPFGIWEMPQLRHLNIDDALFVDPPVTQIGRKDYVILENLHTLRYVINFRCSEEILKRIPNVKKLEIKYRKHSEELVPPTHLLCNLADLHKLDFLRCKGVNLEEISFPNSLTNLYLQKCNCPWGRMTIIGSLPNLELLVLDGTIGGPEWNPVEGEFLQLKVLAICNNDLVRWNAEKNHFPILELLGLEDMHSLEEIPSGIGEIETLRMISLEECKKTVVNSAKEIIEEQRSYGNEDLQLEADSGYSDWESDVEDYSDSE